jgi:hypothetical protein
MLEDAVLASVPQRTVERFDWTPEIDLVKELLLPDRVQVLLDSFGAARKRAL